MGTAGGISDAPDSHAEVDAEIRRRRRPAAHCPTIRCCSSYSTIPFRRNRFQDGSDRARASTKCDRPRRPRGRARRNAGGDPNRRLVRFGHHGYVRVRRHLFRAAKLPDGRTLPLRTPIARLTPNISSGHESTVSAEDTVGDIFVPYYSLWQIVRKGKNFVLGAGSVLPANTEAMVTAQPNGSIAIVTPPPLLQSTESPNSDVPGAADGDAAWRPQAAAPEIDAASHARPRRLADDLASWRRQCFRRLVRSGSRRGGYSVLIRMMCAASLLALAAIAGLAATPAPKATLSPVPQGTEVGIRPVDSKRSDGALPDGRRCD